MSDIDSVIDNHHGNTRTVLEYSRTVGRLVHEAKKPGFTVESWAPLARLVDTENFVRVGNFKEVMNWAQYTAFLTGWATASLWDATFRRISTVEGIVFLELEEHSTIGDFHSVVNSASIYEFDDAGRIARVDVYLQMELPSPDLLAGGLSGDTAQ
ncbi:hypothetical protein [Mycolicibacter hiberniae]|uniref:Uncharacterized protein n=1 Tax=Mycolicibacter hiberniae TaxID=29314 RepID=A0A7I7X6J8_9MYCO|nr:hypothetical protein [Mycolicibacter hiberniae]MCV7085040.1 hypothetical protein [Mycolicibacter hiberniae]ORV68674.1 hypothetical protein AWC09_15080 [Mycolicibacter hiberniae]BBZ25326.1 hypothetical protein MHIB_37440 [Mycolicibacter hiberniae]